MKRVYAGMNEDPNQHIQHAHAEARARADQRFTQMFNAWSTAERTNRCRETLQNMEMGYGSYRERPEYEILMSF